MNRLERTMPDLNTALHLKMLRRSKRTRNLARRILGALKKEFSSRDLYGLEWGDPEVVEPLQFIRDRYLLPYVIPEKCAVEIGPGGGRWTRYMLGFRKLYVVDYYQEMLTELGRNFVAPNLTFVKNNGTDFPGINDRSVDYLFSFGTFVHLDMQLIAEYLSNMRRILKPDANIVIQYSDKTKVMGQINDNFSDNTPEKMRSLVLAARYKICEEDLTSMWHSSVIRFRK
jgi:SAM-dependent methyltransferase